MRPSPAWNALLKPFRRLGGLAENLELAEGPHGFALVPVDRLKPSRLFVPQTMLVPTAHTCLDAQGCLTVRPGAPPAPALADFFNLYQRTVGWSGGGRERVAADLARLHDLPAPLTQALAAEAHLGWLFEPHDEQALLDRYLHARHIDWQGTPVFMPLMDLVNHDWRAANYGFSDDGLTIAGMFPEGEMTVCYNLLDPWQRFIRYGFVSEERHAYSIPMAIRTAQGTLTVGGEPGQARTRAGHPFPVASRQGPDVSLSHLMLGDRRSLDAPRSIFVRIAAEMGLAQPILLFDRIAHINRLFFLRLLGLAEGESEAVKSFRRLCRFQLEAMSHAVGAREIA